MSDQYSNEAARLAPGTRLNGVFEIEERIASGGMGEIYRGHLIETGDAVAIKVMRGDLAGNETALALFRKEASALHHVHHEAVVRYYVFSNDPLINRHYLAMEFVDGEPLSALLRRGALSFDAVELLRGRLASGLDAVHRHGIIHRDVSPDNVIVPGGDVGRAKIIDFGIARSTRAGDRTIIGGNFAGKYNYVSPEQLGLFGGEVTATSDIYSLGIVLAQCLSGQRIDMGGSEFEVVEKRRVVPDLRGVDERYRPLLVRMLQPDPKDRPAAMADVAAWRPLAGPPGAAEASADASAPGSSAALRRPPARRKRSGETIELVTLVLLTVLCCGAVGYYLTREPASGPQPAKPPIIERADEGKRAEREATDRRAAEERARQEAAVQAERQRVAEDAAKREAEERAQREAAAQAERQRVAEDAAKREAEERAQREAAAQAERQRVAEDAAKREAKERAQREAAAQAERQRVAEDAAKREAEERARQEAAAQTQRQRIAQDQAARQAEERARQEAAGAAMAEAERQAVAQGADAQREAEGRAEQSAAATAAAEAERVAQEGQRPAGEATAQEAVTAATQAERQRIAEEATTRQVETPAEQEKAAAAEAERQRMTQLADAEREAEERTRQEAVAVAAAEAERQRQVREAEVEREAAERRRQEMVAGANAQPEYPRVAPDADTARQAGERARQETAIAATAEAERQRVAQDADANRQAEERARREAGVFGAMTAERERLAQAADAERQTERAGQDVAAAQAEHQRTGQEEEAKRQGNERAGQVAAAALAEGKRLAQEASARQQAVAERQRLDREAALRAEQQTREQAERRSRITRFVNNYEGGDCFFITPILVAADQTNLEGFGASVAPFEALDTEFKRANGFEAYIGLHQVTPPQCAAVTFLSRTRNQPSVSSALEIGATVVKSGSPLTGSVADIGDHHVELLLVGEDGAVRNFTSRLSPGEGARSFALDLVPKKPGPAQPQLLIAVVSKAPLAALKPVSPGSADEVFARALAEARDTGQSLNVSAKYFKLEN